jgi:hypothetical protein
VPHDAQSDRHGSFRSLPIAVAVTWRLATNLSPEARAELRAAERSLYGRIGGLVRAGRLDDALYLYGNRQRLGAVERWTLDGRPGLRPLLAMAWSTAEPDDTDPFYLILWRRIAAGERIDDEGGPMPPGDPLTVYRGQAGRDDPLGIAWSLDPDVADWFALRFDAAGVVLTGTVPRDAILGYLDGRNEAEAVCDPADVTITGSRPADPAARARRMASDRRAIDAGP